MRQSGISLGSIGGTTIRVEISFLVLVGLFVLIDLESRQPLQVALLWIPVLFLSVLVHELAHAAAIAIFGYGRSEIFLSGYGGLTVNRRAARPWQDMLISLAGPLSSFAIAGAAAYAQFYSNFLRTDAMMVVFVPMLARANLVWGLFNLLPVFPLDGGQAFRSFLRIFTSERSATVASVWVSFLFAGVTLVYAIFSKWFFLAIIAGMLLMQNYQRWQAIRASEPPPPPPQP